MKGGLLESKFTYCNKSQYTIPHKVSNIIHRIDQNSHLEKVILLYKKCKIIYQLFIENTKCVVRIILKQIMLQYSV